MNVCCPICSSEAKLFAKQRDRVFLSDTTSQIFKCGYCKTLFIHPLPSNEEILRHYEKLDNSYYSFKVSDVQRTDVIEGFFKAIARSKAIPKGNSIEGLKGERLLDVGCGVGDFLMKARPLFKEVMGVDASGYAVEICRKQGFRVYRGSYEQIQFPRGFFDVITMFHVLEHVTSPYNFLLKAYRELKFGGTIVIGVPDTGSIPAKFFGTNWRGLDPPRHIFCFNENSLKLLLRRVGFKVSQVKKIPAGGENIRSIFIGISNRDPDIDSSRIFRFVALVNDIMMSPFSNFSMNNFMEVKAIK